MLVLFQRNSRDAWINIAQIEEMNESDHGFLNLRYASGYTDTLSPADAHLFLKGIEVVLEYRVHRHTDVL